MKQCPRCDRNYDDDALSFCLEDGTRLVRKYEPEPTMVNPNPPVQFVPPTVPYVRPPVEPPEPRQRSPWVIAALVALALGVGLTIGGFIFQRTSSTSTASPAVARDLEPVGNNSSTPSAAVSTPTPSPTPVVSATESTVPAASSTPVVPASTCVLYNDKSDKNVVRVRLNCDSRDCDNDESTILQDYPDNTPISLAKANNVQGARFTWVKIIITSTSQVAWVASTKIKCT